jgi:hypothetical protein
MLLKVWCERGGGIAAALNGEKPDGEGNDWVCSNLMGGSDIREAIDGWVLAGGSFGGAVLVPRPSPFSEVYMTATFVLGEFMVPVSDHPIATRELVTEKRETSRRGTLTGMYHRRPRNVRRPHTFPYCSRHLRDVAIGVLSCQVGSPAKLSPPTRAGE